MSPLQPTVKTFHMVFVPSPPKLPGENPPAPRRLRLCFGELGGDMEAIRTLRFS